MFLSRCSKNNRPQRISYTAALLFVAILGYINVAHSAILYSVAPLIIDTKAEPRDVITRTITLTNTGTQPITVFPTVNNISLNAGGTIEEFLSPVMSDRTASLAAWVEIQRSGIDIPMNGSKTVDLTLRIHPEPKPGVYHAFIGFGFGRNRDEAEAQVARGQAPGTVVTVTIEDKRRSVLKLSQFIIDRFILKEGNQAAVYTITNPGDTPLTPKGDLIIYDTRGREVGSLTLNETNETIAPGDTHRFTADVPTNGLFGRYKAFLSVEYGGAQLASMQDTSFFYVFPLKKTIIVFLILAALVTIIALYAYRRFNNTDHDDSEYLTLHIRDSTTAVPTVHDIDLTRT